MAEQTGITPEALENYPAVPEAFHEHCEAFILLSSRRSVGMTANAITLTDMNAYMDMFGVPVYGARVFVDLMVLMDAKYLELIAKK